MTIYTITQGVWECLVWRLTAKKKHLARVYSEYIEYTLPLLCTRTIYTLSALLATSSSSSSYSMIQSSRTNSYALLLSASHFMQCSRIRALQNAYKAKRLNILTLVVVLLSFIGHLQTPTRRHPTFNILPPSLWPSFLTTCITRIFCTNSQ